MATSPTSNGSHYPNIHYHGPAHTPTSPSYQSQDGAANQDSTNEQWSGDDSGAEQGEEGGDSKKRKRPMSVSCEMCKQRKVKCDRGQPACGWCLRNGQLCEYKERKKPGLRAGYGRELEARLDRLETVLQQQQAILSQLTNGPLPSAVQHHGPVQQETNLFATVEAQQHVHEGGVLVDTPGLATETATYTPQSTGLAGSFEGMNGSYPQNMQGGPYASAKHERLLGQPDAQTFYRSNSADGPLSSPTTNVPHPAPQATMTGSQEHDFPPYDVLYSLADLYFKHINTWCPVLHRKSTLDALFGSGSLDEADRILLHAIVATTMRFLPDDHRIDAEGKKRYHTASKQKVLLYGLDNSSVRALQALVILALDITGSSNGPPGWNLLALITRSAVQLGLSIEATSPAVAPRYPSIYTLRAMVLTEPSSWIEEESRRRLFWMIYILDRYATLTTAFDFALNEKEIDRKLPCRDDLFARNQPVETRWFHHEQRTEKSVDRPENLGSFSYYVEVVGILSQIHTFLKKPVDIGLVEDVERWQTEYRGLDAQLSAWKKSLPKEYGNTARLFDNSSAANKVVNCGWVMLHATYHTTVIRLHTSAAYPARRSTIFAPSFAASRCALSAVESISALCGHVKSNGMLNKLGPPYAFSLWVAARVLLVHSSTIDHQIDPAIHMLVDTLREMGTHWKVADRYALLLQRVLDEFAESEQAAATQAEDEHSAPASVKILADMRRCAYDLDFLISRQPRLQMAAGQNITTNSNSSLLGGGNTGNGGSGSGGGHVVTTPSRTPAPSEFEYLDLFDFFNMPRLPTTMEGASSNNGGGGGGGGSGGGGFAVQNFGVADGDFSSAQGTFVCDANVDWFNKAQQD